MPSWPSRRPSAGGAQELRRRPGLAGAQVGRHPQVGLGRTALDKVEEKGHPGNQATGLRKVNGSGWTGAALGKRGLWALGWKTAGWGAC